MLPYVEFTRFSIGPLTIQVWGTMVALGILLGSYVSARFAGRAGYDREIIYRGTFWIIVSAFVGARVLHVIAYDPAYYFGDPLEALRIWHGGFSSFGGFAGAAVGYILFVKRTKINWRAYADSFIYGLPLGLGCGRIGCFLIHDHPGTLTNSPLGIQYPDGQIRHDHGLYLSLNGFLLAFVFFIMARKQRSPGFFCQIFLLWYGTVRFILDFYRLIDVRYFGLTPAQYGCLAMVIGGLAWVVYERRFCYSIRVS